MRDPLGGKKKEEDGDPFYRDLLAYVVLLNGVEMFRLKANLNFFSVCVLCLFQAELDC